MKKLDKLKLKGFFKMSEVDMKNIIGGYKANCEDETASGACLGKNAGDTCCTTSRKNGSCTYMPVSGLICYWK
ncbi:TIGR04149 family rSAM-modified RiPP [Dysgonomonas sp. 37-18]|uniref:TIGR04149 family rSAM-modified RiPP n=1 Tax=Dysgonomonas sp. 37-18 TaxID=1895907 RepID=UPI0009287EA4|nr:TIGR04149 family rSAM-modified RiPP [Dysgonomonas sp. 37-18]OJX62668.1 MAG: hypothetical protein BGO84_04015 [Dysgonomonas sp. 37-18]